MDRNNINLLCNLSSSDLDSRIERCSRLINNSALLKRLPDGGEKIKKQYAQLLSARSKKQNDSEEMLEVKETNFNVEEASIAGKYRSYRVSVEKRVRDMYEGSLSEKEIQKIIEDVPSTFLLTQEETEAMEQAIVRQRRKAELEKLRKIHE